VLAQKEEYKGTVKKNLGLPWETAYEIFKLAKKRNLTPNEILNDLLEEALEKWEKEGRRKIIASEN